MNSRVWSSKAIQLTPEVCVDVKADAEGVVLRQVGKVVFEDVHFTSEQARASGYALIEGAVHADLAAQADA